MSMGPWLKGMGVSVSVGVWVTVGVSEGVSVSVGGRVGVGGNVCVAASVEVLVMVAVGLKNKTFADEFSKNQAATTNKPTRRLTIQNPATNRRNFADEAVCIYYPAS